MFRALFGMLSPPGERGRLSILIFHRVVPHPDPLFPGEVDASNFDRICAWIARWFQVLPLDSAVARLAAGHLPSRAMAITFDDGYADNRTVALPILQRHGLTATFFVATGFVDGGRMWNDTVIEAIRRCGRSQIDFTGSAAHSLGVLPVRNLDDKRAAISQIIGRAKYLELSERSKWVLVVAERACAELPDDLMMSSGQVREMHRAGMGIGAHTVNHPILSRLGADAVRSEILECRVRLEEVIGTRVTLFAYPNGKPGEDYRPETVAVVRDLGFNAAVSTAWGAASQRDDRFQLPRFTPWDRTRLRFGTRLLRNLATRDVETAQ